MKAIAAMSLNRVIGANGTIPWHLSEDLKFFKRTTLGHIMVMGRKTYDSIGKPLPGRESWVVSRAGAEIKGVKVFREVEEIADPGDGREIFVIGGAQIYAALMPRCGEICLTLVKREVEGDTFFPAFEGDFTPAEVLVESPEMEIRRWVRKTPIWSGGL